MRSSQKIRLLCAVSAIALASAANAQPAETAVESVVVTGSRVIADAANSPTPLTVVSTAALEATTPSNIPDALNKLPIFQGSAQPRTAGNGGTASGMNVLSLRNFGAQRTLILLDGHRVPASNADGTVDIDTLPQMLIERTEVVTGGASAVYGSDAVTGVVNFVLDKNFTGFKVDVNGGISTFGDGASHKIEMAAGTSLFGGRGHFEAAISHFAQDGVFEEARKYGPINYIRGGAGTTANPYTILPNGRVALSSFDGKITCTGCAANGMHFAAPGVIAPFTHGAATGVTNIESGGDGAYGALGSLTTAFRSNNAFARFSYDLDDTTNFYVQGTAAEGYADGPWYNVLINPGTNLPNIFYANNPFLPAPAQAALSGGPNNTFQLAEYIYTPKSGRDHYINTRNVNRNLTMTTGFKGNMLSRFDWDLYYTHGENRQAVTNVNNTDNQALYAAEDAVAGPNGSVVCYVSTTAFASRFPGCTPINPFGPNTVSAAAFKYITKNTQYRMTNKLDDIGASVAGEVIDAWAGPIKAALSAEMRFADYLISSNSSPNDLVDCTGLRNCAPAVRYTQNTVAPVHASNNVWEVAAEFQVPLLKDLPLIQTFDANLAGRYTDYSSSGTVQTWKVGLDWHVNDDIRFRGTTSVDIRAPTLNDLFAPAQQSFQGFTDVHTGASGSLYNAFGGNPNLKPEVARTYTAGIVYTASAIPGLTVSLDYYSIRLKNAIGSIAASNVDIQNLCERSGGTSSYCDLYVRPLPFSNTTAANYPLSVKTLNLNTAFTTVEGWDLEANYHFDMEDVWSGVPGSVDLRLLGNNQPVVQTQQFVGATISNSLLPKTRVTTFLNYNLNDWTFSVQNRWYSGAPRASNPSLVYASPRINSFDSTDFTVTRDFTIDGNDMSGYVTVQNAFNSYAPLNPTGASNPGLFYPVPAGYDVLGRYFTIGLRAKL
jgi:iron complex outermembrane receptor protein